MNTSNLEMKKINALLLLVVHVALLMAICTQMLHAISTNVAGDLHPIILIPGSGGNQLEARLKAAYKPSTLLCRFSRRKSQWFRIWFDPSVLLSPFTRCFAERMMLKYDEDIDDYFNAAGVETRVPWFGSVKGLLYLDPQLKHITDYMATLVNSLEEIGYVDELNLFGAPYDFRYGLAAEGHPSKVGTQYLQDLKKLIEEAYTSTGGKPVIIVSHSLGGLFALHLLNRNTPSWRNRFIKHFVALSAPWGGTVQEMLTFASGYTLGIPLVDPLLVRGEQRSSESNLWLLPNPSLFRNRTLVVTGNRSYSSLDMREFLSDIGFQEGVHPYGARIVPLIEKLVAPNVPMTCLIGSGIDTPEKLYYGDGGFDEQPEIEYGDGDGTVNMESLLALQSQWSGNKRELLRVKKISGVSHNSILKDGVAIQEILSEIHEINSVLQAVT